MAPDKLEIPKNLADIDRGIKIGTPKRMLYKDLSEIDTKAHEGMVVSEEGLKKVLGEYADKIHGTTAEKDRK